MVPLDRADVDTDQIIPQSFLKRVERTGYGRFLFHSWANREDGAPDPGFVLNHPERQGARVLVAGPNFGCGSSREHAAWAIQDWGFEAVIAPSFADIFRNNAANIGLLAAEADPEVVDRLIGLAADPAAMVRVDLRILLIESSDVRAGFTIDEDMRRRLLAGLDRIGETLTMENTIAAYETGRPSWMPVTVVAD